MSGCVLMLNMRAHSAKRRLVHRLDRETSGALVVARTAAAAAWLSAAFSRCAAAAVSSGGGGISGVDGGRRRQPLRHAGPASQPSVQRVYWAVVECGSGSAVQPAGIIEEPLEVPLAAWQPEKRCTVDASCAAAADSCGTHVQHRPFCGACLCICWCI